MKKYILLAFAAMTLSVCNAQIVKKEFTFDKFWLDKNKDKKINDGELVDISGTINVSTAQVLDGNIQTVIVVLDKTDLTLTGVYENTRSYEESAGKYKCYSSFDNDGDIIYMLFFGKDFTTLALTDISKFKVNKVEVDE